MAIQYAGGTIVSTTFTGTAKSDILSNMETQLTAAGWTTASGTGSTDIVMASATTPTASNSIRVRMRSTNLTNCACFNLVNAAGTITSQNFFVLPGALKTYRVIANKYQFFLFTPGSTACREYIGMGVPYIPSFLHGVITGDLGWAQGNATSDTDTAVPATARATFRTHLTTQMSGATTWSAAICNSSSLNGQNATLSGHVGLVIPWSVVCGVTSGYRWHDDSLFMADPLLAWGLTSTGDEGKVRGQLWDAMVVTDTFAGDSTLSSVNGHNWWALTNTNNGTANNTAKGTVFLATS